MHVGYASQRSTPVFREGAKESRFSHVSDTGKCGLPSYSVVGGEVQLVPFLTPGLEVEGRGSHHSDPTDGVISQQKQPRRILRRGLKRATMARNVHITAVLRTGREAPFVVLQ